ncbi:PIN domain-containing protein [Streptomyces sp. NPDC058964]|uniref:PIN domain-containing protein n=1 Tax=Streptomyces sp. NPDC058964 TaxID=3346681 RepID=UPI0036CE2156
MIIFDTNAVRLLNPASDKADLIRKLRASGQRVGIPSMVLVEMAAQQVLRYRDAYGTVASAISKLQAVTPSPLGQQTGPDFQPDTVDSYWTEQYGDLFQVLETTPEMAMQALSREAHGLKPAKRDRNDRDGDTKTGARDVAIWLTLVGYMREHPAEHVYFVTANTSDFGDGSTFPMPMDEDARGMLGRLTVLNGWNDVVDAFTTKVDATVDGEEMLRSARLVRTIQLEAKERMRNFFGLTSWMPGSGVSWTEPGGAAFMETWVVPPIAALLNIDEISGHEIGDAVWYTANTTWLLAGIAMNSDPASSSAFVQLNVKWPVKVLFSTSDHPPVVISSDPPMLPDFQEGSPDLEARQQLSATLLSTRIPSEASQGSLEDLLVLLAASTGDLPSQLRNLRNSLAHGVWPGDEPPNPDVDPHTDPER